MIINGQHYYDFEEYLELQEKNPLDDWEVEPEEDECY